ncbi:hypothetical protein BDV29DRAFT_153873 [Aspergillus leporis]|uniref:DUF7703 domain-containing protein n=1 Tax=Aspergillus leporis TaxID=41062 RepID=A0A5N5XD99_9EURO|nr:hypothetical protein BDV29DRAFT_153873 [Aspergillus leporis]
MPSSRGSSNASDFFENNQLLSNASLGRIATVACFISIAWYNSIELVVICFSTFKRYGGCYFWCLLIASSSIIPFALGYLLIIFDIGNVYVSLAIEMLGWYGMVVGQSMVLWSRLHLVVQTRRVLRGTLAMIVITAIAFLIPATVLEFGVYAIPNEFSTPFNVFERIQLVGFSIQEIILSMIYAWESVRLLNLRPRDHYRSILVQLLVINLVMICMDAAIIGSQYAGFFTIHVTLKAMVYSIKLKMEYAILGKLVHVSSISFSDSAMTDLS